MLKNLLASGEGKDIIKRGVGVFQIDILDKKGRKLMKTLTIDLKNDKRSWREGGDEKYNALYSVSDSYFFDVCNCKLNPRTAFVQGKI